MTDTKGNNPIFLGFSRHTVYAVIPPLVAGVIVYAGAQWMENLLSFSIMATMLILSWASVASDTHAPFGITMLRRYGRPGFHAFGWSLFLVMTVTAAAGWFWVASSIFAAQVIVAISAHEEYNEMEGSGDA